ncbi:histidine phosphatase family protein [Deinococcus sp.]|uniref:histidine phosphatase family protein n=1 Tax=Deinococcus sp. TaxID=47478 RepID=UPI003CC5D07B
MSVSESPAPARLFLIRHGQTDHNVSQVLRGASGAQTPLNAVGLGQAQQLAHALKALNLPRPRVYASTYLRAQQTAQPLAQALGVPLNILPDSHEIEVGDWEGRPYSVMHDLAHQMIAPDGHFGYPGGESLVGVGERFHTALQTVLPRAGETVLIVSHGAALTAILAHLLGHDVTRSWPESYIHANTALTELLWNENGPPEVIRLADAGHLK